MHVCTSQLVLPIVFIVHLFNIVFYFFYYPYGLLSEIKYYYYYYYINSYDGQDNKSRCMPEDVALLQS